MSLVARYASRLGMTPPADPITLGEGDTPLLPSVALGPRWGLRGLWFKCDHVNPTGSYKDRFNSFVVNLMRERGQTTCLATSSGNTGSSLAAFGARGGIRVVLVINEETPAGKLSQMAAHGAVLLRARGFGKDLDESARIFA
ncbi:MAG: pyridoxal-phosphate dependent enzyme, partial [Armatimonadetes bacterium]|nr:pyridoxal-phosphate dependent enzyme [Armatimonadota bacterium]